MEFYSELEKKISLFSYVFTLFNLIGFTVILIFDPSVFSRLTREDSFTEYAGCALLFLVAILLFGSSALFFKRKPANYLKYGGLFLAASIIFLWAAGEELSWGQRIFSFDIPDFFARNNMQNEFNLHNFDTGFFNKSLQNINLLMIIFSSFLLYKKNNTFIGIPIPNILLVFCLQIAMGYSTYLHINFHDPISILCLCFWIFYFYRQKEDKGLGLSILSLVFIFVSGTINYCLNDSIATNGPREIREYMFSFICLVYSVNIFLYFKNELPVLKTEKLPPKSS